MATEYTTKTYCQCGKRIARGATECRKCWQIRSAAIHAEVQAIVNEGTCPTCGATLRRNLALTGWWQCSQYGAEGFRLHSDRPACGWQGFTA